MPIRFRCVYCDKLLGIARRKAGSVVNCPQCNQPLIVPTPEAEPEPAAATEKGTVNANPGPSKLFERDDFAELLQDDATVRAPENEPRSKRSKRKRGSESPIAPQPFPVERSLPAQPVPMTAPLPYRAKAQSGGMVLTRGKLILALVVVFVLVGLAFGGGVLVGRMLN
jgi:phage FluMu protein Com